MTNEAEHPQKGDRMDSIKVSFNGEVREVTRENAFDFFSGLFPRGIILVECDNGMVGLTVPPREGESNGKTESKSE